MSDYRVKVTVRNARLLRALESIGHTPCSFARAHGFNSGELCELAAMKISPMRRDGDYRASVIKLCELTNKMPSDLFTARQMEAWERTSSETEVSEAALDSYRQSVLIEHDPETSAINRDLATKVSRAIDGLSARYAHAVRLSVDGATLEEIGDELGVGRERARQIVAKGMRQVKEEARRAGVNETPIVRRRARIAGLG